MTNFERALGRMNLRKAKAEPAIDAIGKLAASANQIDRLIAVFAVGVLLGTMITP